MIEFKNITKIYKAKKSIDTEALKDINLKLDNKGLVFITGTSGSGKSTLLNLLGGLDSPTSGDIIVDNQNISKFKNKEYDSYRNSYVGFIFQEFNLLEKLNVYENINLSLELQNKKDNNEITNILKEVGIEELKNRKINELSGGQKQRVAIARALIKNPTMILADEPTGNLDSKSSEQVFNILKEISKDKLVVVVSHDNEAAIKYADRIIKLEDGTIVKDTNKCDKENNTEKIKFIDSKLPNSYKLKLALTNLKVKPLKLAMTIILLSMAFMFMGVTANLLLFDEKIFLTNVMKDNNNYNYEISKHNFISGIIADDLELKKDDIDYLENLTSKKVNPTYLLYDNGKRIDFEFGENKTNNDYYYMPLGSTSVSFVELKDTNIIDKVIGNFPSSDNEILVHKYFADYMIEFGIKLSDDSLYKPADYNKIISDRNPIKLGDNEVYISGIVDDDNSKFLKYKKGHDDETEYDDYRYFAHNYAAIGTEIYVNGLVDNIKLTKNKNVILDNMNLVYGENYVKPENIKYFKNGISIITKDGIKTINSLKENEIILSYNEIAEFNDDYNKQLAQYLKNNKRDKSEEDFALEYLKNNSIGKFVRLWMYTDDGYLVDRNLTVIGISLDNTTYISKKYYDDYNPKEKEIYKVIVNDKNIGRVKKVFSKLKYDGLAEYEKYNGKYYIYDANAGSPEKNNSIILTYKYIIVYCLIICCVFTVFAFLLFSNFISVTIMYAKKEIGILKALGTKNNDVTKIFEYESLVIAIISFILSVISVYTIFAFLNEKTYGKLLFNVRGYIMNPLAVLIMLAVAILVALLITIVSIEKTVKIKPIDAILDK